ncbi:MAG: hypothetical protein KC442_13855 [Thermomicrobiales bacterium]|nr:hypothetical protein [Thermomicrobiales bacterium]
MSKATQQRKQGKPRAAKKEAHGAAPKAAPAPAAAKLSPRAAAFQARRGGAATPASSFVLSREQEMAYIRDDLRRLIYIAGALLVLMLVILYVIER